MDVPFKLCSPMKVSTGPGDFQGTLQGKVEYIAVRPSSLTGTLAKALLAVAASMRKPLCAWDSSLSSRHWYHHYHYHCSLWRRLSFSRLARPLG